MVKVKSVTIEWEGGDEYQMNRKEFRETILNICIEVAMELNFAESFGATFEGGDIIIE